MFPPPPSPPHTYPAFRPDAPTFVPTATVQAPISFRDGENSSWHVSAVTPIKGDEVDVSGWSQAGFPGHHWTAKEVPAPAPLRDGEGSSWATTPGIAEDETRSEVRWSPKIILGHQWASPSLSPGPLRDGEASRWAEPAFIPSYVAREENSYPPDWSTQEILGHNCQSISGLNPHTLNTLTITNPFTHHNDAPQPSVTLDWVGANGESLD